MKPEDTANLIAAIGTVISVVSARGRQLGLPVVPHDNKGTGCPASKAHGDRGGAARRGVEARRHAQVTASIPGVRNGPGRLVLTNEGPAVARSVTVAIASADEAKPPAVFGLERLPVDLRPGQPMSFDLVASWGDATLINALVRWVDDAGPHEATYTLRTL